ncbi:hypothetical protein DVH24_023373 [Malus domestica]|uniref:Uncharacterized protein n=1 Tax=Malus domestica TaxID=3750 RepID=A0A498KU07_MALDO|nr:hypothetical protein DVH24_023373 [Malus domestica]
MLQSTLLKGLMSSSAHSRPGIGYDTKFPGPIKSRARLRHIKSWPRPCPHDVVSRNSHENFPIGHPSLYCSRANTLNFEVPMEFEAREFPKGLMLGRDENIHKRLTGPIPLGDVGFYNPPSLGARRLCRHTPGLGLALIPCKAYKIHSPRQCGMLQSTPLKGPKSSSAHSRLGISSNAKLSHPSPGPHHIPCSTPP